jgi:hypothetical protein
MSSHEDISKNEESGQFNEDFVDLDQGAFESLDIWTRDEGMMDLPGRSSFDGPYYHQQQRLSDVNDPSIPPANDYGVPTPVRSNANSSAGNSVDLAAERLIAQKRAKDNIRRGVLYRSGAKARVPKTKVSYSRIVLFFFIRSSCVLIIYHFLSYRKNSNLWPRALSSCFRS